MIKFDKKTIGTYYDELGKKKPGNIVTGFTYGTAFMVGSVAKGLSGVIVKPI